MRERCGAGGAGLSHGGGKVCLRPLSIPEFCRFVGVSRSLYYRLARLGLAPRCLRLGRRVLIRAEEVAAWMERFEGKDGTP